MPATFITRVGQRVGRMQQCIRHREGWWCHHQLWCGITQSLSETLLYGCTFYILLSSPGKIKAKSLLSPSAFATLKQCPLSGLFARRSLNKDSGPARVKTKQKESAVSVFVHFLTCARVCNDTSLHL